MMRTLFCSRLVAACCCCAIVLASSLADEQFANGDEPAKASAENNPAEPSPAPLGIARLAGMFQQLAGSGLSLEGLIKPETLGLDVHDNELEVELLSGNQATVTLKFLSDLQIHVHVHVGVPTCTSAGGKKAHNPQAKAGQRKKGKQAGARKRRRKAKAATTTPADE